MEFRYDHINAAVMSHNIS